jgi:ABC-type uncharacterized transport system substrate-binding protein
MRPWLALKFGAVASLLVAFSAGVAAHPHVLPQAKITLHFSSGTLNRIDQVWVYDNIYSKFILRDVDKNADGAVSPEEFKAFGQSHAEALAAFNFFTKVRFSGAERSLVLDGASTVKTLTDGRIEVAFSLVPPTQSGLPMEVRLFDPDFFAYFSIRAEDVHTDGLAPGCSVAVDSPAPLNLQDTRSVPQLFWQALDGSKSAAGAFVSALKVACAD